MLLIPIFFAVVSLHQSWKKRQWLEIFSIFIHYFFVYNVLGFGRYFILLYYLGSLYFLINFSLSHTHLPVTTEPVHWVEYSLTHTTNVRSGQFKWVDYWMGYLNYQIEHHLFPTMPQFRNQLIRDRVKQLAKKHGLPYNLMSYSEALKKTFANLGTVVEELK